MNRHGSARQRRTTSAAAVAVLVASIYLWFAAAVMLLLALTDISGFLTNVAAIALTLALGGSAPVFDLIGLRMLGRPNDRHGSTH